MSSVYCSVHADLRFLGLFK